MPPRIFVAGYYGFGNEGDEAILEGLRSTVAELRSDTAWVVTSGAPSLTTRRHGVRAIHWREPAAIASEIAACDLVIVGGGGLFQDYWGCDVSTLFTPEHANITFYGLPVILAGLLGKPAVLYAVGVGPLRTPEGRAFVCALATSATSVSVRDEGSREALVQSGVPHRLVHLSADPVFALPAPPRGDQEDLVGVSLRHWALPPTAGDWESRVAAGLDLFLDAHPTTRLLFVPFQNGSRELEDDRACSDRIRQRLRRPERTSVLDPRENDPRHSLARCRLVLGMRLHAVLFAMAAGRPVVGLAYDPKIESALREAGRPECVVHLQNVEERDLARVLSTARAADADHVADLRRRARLAGERAIEALESGQPSRLTPSLGAIVAGAWQEQVARGDSLRRQVLSDAHERAALADHIARLEDAALELARLRSTRGYRLLEIYWRAATPVRHRLEQARQRLISSWHDATGTGR